MATAQALHRSLFAPRLTGVMQARPQPLFFVPLASYVQKERLLQFHVHQARSVTAPETVFLLLLIAMLDIIALVVAQQPP
jgi:hypothetical protein